jgi:DNA-binding GntR family transcriptional regulator
VETEQADPRLYIKLATRVRAQIQAGELTPGLPAPPIASLRHATGYSRQTCSKALQLLEQEGLLRRIPGLGYHVAIQAGSDPSRRRDPGRPGCGRPDDRPVRVRTPVAERLRLASG